MKLKDEGKADDRRLSFHPSAFILHPFPSPSRRLLHRGAAAGDVGADGVAGRADLAAGVVPAGDQPDLRARGRVGGEDDVRPRAGDFR